MSNTSIGIGSAVMAAKRKRSIDAILQIQNTLLGTDRSAASGTKKTGNGTLPACQPEERQRELLQHASR
jgi:hypothetical protein